GLGLRSPGVGLRFSCVGEAGAVPVKVVVGVAVGGCATAAAAPTTGRKAAAAQMDWGARREPGTTRRRSATMERDYKPGTMAVDYDPAKVPSYALPPCAARPVERTQGSLEFGGNLVQGWGDSLPVPRLEQFLHASTGGSYCISQGARPSSSGVVRGRSLASGQPILHSGYATRLDVPAALDLIKRVRLTQLRDEHASKPRHLLLGRCKIGPPSSSTVCPHEKRSRYRGGKKQPRQRQPKPGICACSGRLARRRRRGRRACSRRWADSH